MTQQERDEPTAPPCSDRGTLRISGPRLVPRRQLVAQRRQQLVERISSGEDLTRVQRDVCRPNGGLREEDRIRQPLRDSGRLFGVLRELAERPRPAAAGLQRAQRRGEARVVIELGSEL